MDFLESAQHTFEIETRAIRATIDTLDGNAFEKASSLLLNSKGRVIVTGIGKSGHIANKIASTLASTGTPAFFLHPSEALHGDVGMVRREDVVIVLSKSGASDELLLLISSFRHIGVPIIAMTCVAESKLAESASDSGGAVLVIHCDEEACPHDLAPTASTTAMLVLGDALAMALLEARNFSSADFARLHPAGALGKKLTFSVADLMAKGEAIPKVPMDATLQRVMMEMSRKRFGTTAVMDGENIVGIITDGDLRRYFESHATIDINSVHARELMSKNPRTIPASALAIEALHAMEDLQPKVMQLLAVDNEDALVGIIHIHDIVKAGISV